MKILVVDDEAMQRDLLSGFLKKKGYDVFTASNGAEAIDCVAEHPVQLVLLDHRMPDMTGDEVLYEIKKINPMIRAIMITAYGSVDTAVEVMKLGADDFFEKPVDLLSLLNKIQMIEQREAVEIEAGDVAEVLDQGSLPIKIIGDGQAMKEILSLVRRVAPTPWTVLIYGETGTGKELIARLIHMLSLVAEGPFVEVNCGAIPENLFESELFGHEKGAFTGASARRQGRFEQAENGTLFLDEIGELPYALQSKLLRVLQEKKFNRVGSGKELTAEVRVVTATNRDLKKLVDEGRFREDLYYRLNVFDIEIPSLRQRREDIPALAAFFLEKYGLRPIQIEPEAMNTLIKYDFPGNVRQLEHIIQRTATLIRGNVVRSSDLPSEIQFHKPIDTGTMAERLDAVEKEMIMAALVKNDWVKTRAAKSLGISERVLRYKMEKLKIRK